MFMNLHSAPKEYCQPDNENKSLLIIWQLKKSVLVVSVIVKSLRF